MRLGVISSMFKSFNVAVVSIIPLSTYIPYSALISGFLLSELYVYNQSYPTQKLFYYQPTIKVMKILNSLET